MTHAVDLLWLNFGWYPEIPNDCVVNREFSIVVQRTSGRSRENVCPQHKGYYEKRIPALENELEETGEWNGSLLGTI